MNPQYEVRITKEGDGYRVRGWMFRRWKQGRIDLDFFAPTFELAVAWFDDV